MPTDKPKESLKQTIFKHNVLNKFKDNAHSKTATRGRSSYSFKKSSSNKFPTSSQEPLSETSHNERTIRFKSTEENYKKEELGIKSNTVRFTDDWEPERWGELNEATHVVISNKDDPKEKFKRRIKDKTEYKNVVVISW